MNPHSPVNEQTLRERIVQKAYELYEKRGRMHGNDLDDWLEAERLALAEPASEADTKAKSPRSRVPRSRLRPRLGRRISPMP